MEMELGSDAVGKKNGDGVLGLELGKVGLVFFFFF